MAEDEVNGDSDEIQEKSQKKTAKYDSGAADLEKVTDYAEEKEISTQDFSGVQSLNMTFKINVLVTIYECFFLFIFQAITAIGDRRIKEAEEKMAKERELLKVSIKKEDVDLIVSTAICINNIFIA